MNRILINSLIITSLLFQAFPKNPVSTKTYHSTTDAPSEFAPEVQTPPPVINTSDETGMVTFIGSADGSPIPVASASLSSLSVSEKASQVLTIYAPMFGIEDPRRELSLLKSETGEDRKSLRYQQVYQGIPVLAGEIILNVSSQGDLYSMSGEASPNLSLSTTPKISADQAISQAVELMETRYGVKKSNLTLVDPELWIFDERLLLPSTKPAELVWRMAATAKDRQPLDVLILVNAERGGISLQFNQVDTDVTGRTWRPVSPQENASPAGEKETAPTPTPTPQPIPPDPGEPESPEDEVNPLEVKTRYVSPSGNDSPGYYCDTISFPCKTIQWAINKSNPGDTVKVASGTYTFSGTGNPTPNVIIVSKSITLLGGWDVGFVSQNGAAIIDGENVNNGILAQNASATILVDKFIIQNSISYDGGGIYLSGATFTLRNSTIWNNHARRNGAGIFVGDNGNLSLLNSTISDNIADASGGGIFVGNGTVNILYSTIADNQASSEVAGVDNSGGTVSLKNSILANDDIASAQRDCSGTIGTSDHNVISNTSLCTIVAGTGDQFNFDPKININLDFVLPIYTLLAGSPAIDTGDSTNCPFTDEVGNLRPADGDGNGSALCDIGAYENQDLVNIIEVDGSGQSTVINSAYPSPLKVKVVDNWGVPIGGVLITFSAPESGASGIFTSSNSSIEIVTSDSSGFATSSTFTANGIPGNFIVQATALGFATHVDFQLNNAFILYVATTGNDINDCLATTTPCATIQAAVDKAASGDRILITAETYTGTNTDIVYITKDISLVGGWDPTFTTQTGMTLLDGETLRRGIRIVTAVVQLKRFNIMNGFNSDSGGGIRNTGTLTLEESSISNNSANNYGGGILSGGQLIMDGTTVFNNSASRGGGISVGGVTIIQNSTFSYNLADVEGGAIENSGNLVLKNTTIFGNRSTDWGGGIGGDGATVENSIISNNTDENASSVCGRGDINSLGHNIFGDLEWCPLDPQPSDLIGIDPNIFYLDEIGMAALYPFSPAVDAGNPATCLAEDQRGLTRPVDGNGDGVATCDIGAHEYSGGGTTPTAIYPFHGLTRSTILERVIDIPLGVFAMDENGQGVAGVNITFTAPAAGASGIFLSNGLNTITIPTNEVGLALVGDFKTNNIAGSLTVQATAVGLGNPVIFYIANGMKISTYTMNHQEDPPGNLPGNLVCNETQPACSNGDDLDADHAQSYAIDTFKFYLQHHMRNSLDGNGMPIVNSVHYGTNYENAFWDGSRAVFGDNQPTDDIVGHELTHAVTESTSGLFYYYQSGAINESFSDLWGEFIDQTNGAGNDTHEVKWMLGEDNEIYRRMDAPTVFFQPDKMTSFYYHHGDQEDLFKVAFDNGGVHTNSGVNNKAVYFMANGGYGYGDYVAEGLGINKVAAIYYEAQTHLLTSGSDYKDLYYALNQACLNVIGEAEGVTLADCSLVARALNMVEMNQDPLTGFMPEAQLCASNEQPNNLFLDDFESTNSLWDLSNHTPADVFWNRVSGYAASGLNSLYGINFESITDISATMATAVRIPSSGSTYLYFNHAFGFEYSPDFYGGFQTWDGGVLEYKVDNGAWQDANSLWDSGQKYNGSIRNSPGTDNPLGGRSAFVRDSHGYISSRYNLGIAALQGHNVKFRWRVGSDSMVGNLGWVVDDVRIYTCEPNPVQTFLLSVSKTGTGSGTVTSSPAGINCGATCSGPFNENSVITLTATPASSKSRFSGWSGAGCSGTGTCQVTMSAANSVTASFELAVFDDVPFGYSQTLGGVQYDLYPYIQALWDNGFTNGIWIEKDGSGNITYALYGPTNNLNRGMVAKFLLNVVHGRDYSVPPLPSTPLFTLDNWSNPDIAWARPWAEELLAEALTNGCYFNAETGDRAYCPTNISTRAEAAKFGLTMKYGTSYTPPPATGEVFADMLLPVEEGDPPAHWGIAWAEKAYADGLLPACGIDIPSGKPLYCPDDLINRAWSAYMIVKANDLLLP